MSSRSTTGITGPSHRTTPPSKLPEVVGKNIKLESTTGKVIDVVVKGVRPQAPIVNLAHAVTAAAQKFRQMPSVVGDQARPVSQALTLTSEASILRSVNAQVAAGVPYQAALHQAVSREANHAMNQVLHQESSTQVQRDVHHAAAAVGREAPQAALASHQQQVSQPTMTHQSAPNAPQNAHQNIQMMQDTVDRVVHLAMSEPQQGVVERFPVASIASKIVHQMAAAHANGIPDIVRDLILQTKDLKSLGELAKALDRFSSLPVDTRVKILSQLTHDSSSKGEVSTFKSLVDTSFESHQKNSSPETGHVSDEALQNPLALGVAGSVQAPKKPVVTLNDAQKAQKETMMILTKLRDGLGLAWVSANRMANDKTPANPAMVPHAKLVAQTLTDLAKMSPKDFMVKYGVNEMKVFAQSVILLSGGADKILKGNEPGLMAHRVIMSAYQANPAMKRMALAILETLAKQDKTQALEEKYGNLLNSLARFQAKGQNLVSRTKAIEIILSRYENHVTLKKDGSPKLSDAVGVNADAKGQGGNEDHQEGHHSQQQQSLEALLKEIGFEATIDQLFASRKPTLIRSALHLLQKAFGHLEERAWEVSMERVSHMIVQFSGHPIVEELARFFVRHDRGAGSEVRKNKLLTHDASRAMLRRIYDELVQKGHDDYVNVRSYLFKDVASLGNPANDNATSLVA